MQRTRVLPALALAAALLAGGCSIEIEGFGGGDDAEPTAFDEAACAEASAAEHALYKQIAKAAEDTAGEVKGVDDLDKAKSLWGSIRGEFGEMRDLRRRTDSACAGEPSDTKEERQETRSDFDSVQRLLEQACESAIAELGIDC